MQQSDYDTLPGTPDDYSNPVEGFNDLILIHLHSSSILDPVYGPYPGDRDSGRSVGEPDTSALKR